jgi:thiamine biosynthesis lipoprotein ApbE
MPLDAKQAVLSTGSFPAMGTLNTVVVEKACDLGPAMAIVEAQIREIDEVCSRFREDSELSRLNRRSGGSEVTVSPLLEEAIVAALHAAEMTEGLVDLTVGRFVDEAGYTVTFRDLPLDGPPIQLRVQRVLGWRSLVHDAETHTLCLPEGVRLDLGASGKAWAADRAAAAVVDNLGVSVAVECGGDVAVAGAHPQSGWPIRVAADVVADEFQDVVIFDGGLATSGTNARQWRRGGIALHHIIDPSNGLPARTPWAMVSVAAASCLEANAAATAALIMGERARAWLDDLHLPARLVDATGGVHFAGAWCG